MTFNTYNNRILVKDAAGRTTLDTDQPMPHILQTAVANLSCSFPGDGGYSTQHSHSNAMYMYNYQACGYEMVCGFKNVCTWGFVNGVYQQTCSNQYVCEQEYVCRTQQGWRTETSCTVYTYYAAREWSQVQNIVSIINGIDADFIQVNVEATRTTGGQDPWYGTFIAAMPAGRFLSQGSVVLESGFQTGGASWLRRIMSIYVESGVVKVRFQHSNKAIGGRSQNNGVVAYSDSPPGTGGFMPVPGPDSTPGAIPNASAFSFTFYVTIGKFTQ